MTKQLLILVILLVVGFSAAAQSQDNSPASIRAQMAAIRRSTNWNDPNAAKTANEKIQALAAKLTQTLRQANPNVSPIAGMTEKESADLQKETDDFNNNLWNQMMKIASEGGKWDMAEPLREEIVQHYKDDEDPTIKNPEWFQEMSYLLINLSLPQTSVIIDQMPLYKGIKTLVITTEKPVSNLNLSKIFENAKNYPLEDLYIINLGPALSSLPPEASNFTNLKTLGIYNNGLSSLPASVSKLTNLTSLQIQNNPVSSVLSVVKPLKNLKELGVADTKISASEINQIRQSLPDCKILEQ